MVSALLFLLAQAPVSQTTGQLDLKAQAQALATEAGEHPGEAKTWYALGRIRSELARQCYRGLLRKIPPDSPYALAVSAENLMYKQDYRLAFTLFREALRKDPDLLSARSALIEIYTRDNHPDWAKQEQAVLASADCAAQRLACDCLAGKYDAVLSSTESDLRPVALYWRAQAYTGLEYRAFGKLERLPASPELHRFKAGLFYEAGQRSKVVEELRKSLALSPSDQSIRTDLAMALGAAGDYAAAYDLARELLLAQPGSAELNALAGDALLNQQKAETAIPYLRKSLGANPENTAAHASLARAYMSTGKVQLAIPHLNAALPTDRDGSLHYQLARAYQQAGKPTLAAKATREYEKLSEKAKAVPAPEITAP